MISRNKQTIALEGRVIPLVARRLPGAIVGVEDVIFFHKKKFFHKHFLPYVKKKKRFFLVFFKEKDTRFNKIKVTF